VTTVVSPGNGAGSGELAEATTSDSSLRRFLHGLPGVDQVGAEARAAMLAVQAEACTPLFAAGTGRLCRLEGAR